ncbi:hypothetical protein HDU76_012538 [Blyttiomyces sp. JEL0837]|nr:hypothetical protein HDU76_012538 [Blyttiomyces sp. JEL0837]
MASESDRLNMNDLQNIINLVQQQQEQQQSPPSAVTRQPADGNTNSSSTTTQQGASMIDLLRIASGGQGVDHTNDIKNDIPATSTASGFGSALPPTSTTDGEKPKSATTPSLFGLTEDVGGDGSLTYTQAMKLVDPASKLTLMKQAADKGYSKACYEMAKMYENGVFSLNGDLLLQKNMSLALAQYTKAGVDALYRLYTLQHNDATSKEIHPSLHRSVAFGNLNASITLSQILLTKVEKFSYIMHNPPLAKYVANLTGYRDRKIDREPNDEIVMIYLTDGQAKSLDLYYKVLLVTQGDVIHKMAVDGNVDALEELIVAFKWGMRENYSGVSLILSANLASANRPQGYYEVGRHYQFLEATNVRILITVKRVPSEIPFPFLVNKDGLDRVVAMYHHALLLCKNPETDTTTAILSLLALADLLNKGDPSNIFNPLVPKLENLATSYQTLAKELLLQEKTVPISYNDIPHHHDSSLIAIYQGMASSFIQNAQRFIKSGLKEDIGKILEAITAFMEENGGLSVDDLRNAGANPQSVGAGRVNINISSQEGTTGCCNTM